VAVRGAYGQPAGKLLVSLAQRIQSVEGNGRSICPGDSGLGIIDHHRVRHGGKDGVQLFGPQFRPCCQLLDLAPRRHLGGHLVYEQQNLLDDTIGPRKGHAVDVPVGRGTIRPCAHPLLAQAGHRPRTLGPIERLENCGVRLPQDAIYRLTHRGIPRDDEQQRLKGRVG